MTARERDPGRARPGAAWWLGLGALCALARAAWWARDSMPMLFLGDSEAYLGTAIWGRIPSDRSFVYGWLVGLLGVGPGSLRTLVAAQVACSVVAAVMLAVAVLDVAPGRRRLAGAIALGWAALEPLSLFWERYVMAESFALPLFAASVTLGLRYLATAGLGWLVAADVAAAAVMTLRLPYLGMCWLGAVALPALAARRRGLRVACVHALLSVLVVAGLQAGYRRVFAGLAGGDPAFQRADGLFLAAAWAPLLEASDFPDPALGESLLRIASRCMIGDRATREQQRWRDGCLVQELLKATPDEDAANEVAAAAAQSVLRRKPLRVAWLAALSWTDFLDPEQLSTVMTWERSPWDYPVRIRVMLAERFGLDGESMPHLSTATHRWFLRSLPWLMLLAASPACAWCAFALRARRRHRAAQAAWIAILATGLVAITVVAATSPIPRYLHALGWLAGVWIAELLDSGRSRRAAGVPATALLLLGVAWSARVPPEASAGPPVPALARTTAESSVTARTTGPNDEPEPSAAVVGPPASDPAPVLAATIRAWETMKATRYDHREKVNPSRGTWYFDCVGATSAFLRIAAPAADAALNAAEHVRRGFVPSPVKVAHFLRSLPRRGTRTWIRVDDPRQLQGGEIVLVPPPSGASSSGRRIPGHAMIAAGPARRLRDGSLALLVYDSTATPHGEADTRRTDPRNLPIAGSDPPRPSGLGRGTVQLARRPGRDGWFVRWTVGGRRQYGDAVVIGRPLS